MTHNRETQEALHWVSQDEGFRMDLLDRPPEGRVRDLEDWVTAWLGSMEWTCLGGLADAFIKTALEKVDWEYLIAELCKEESE